jgi:hypothetical protein
MDVLNAALKRGRVPARSDAGGTWADRRDRLPHRRPRAAGDARSAPVCAARNRQEIRALAAPPTTLS